MPKKAFDRRYNPEWEVEFPWIRKATGLKNTAYCTVCKITIQPHKTHLRRHGETPSHRRKIQDKNGSIENHFVPSLPNTRVKDKSNEDDFKPSWSNILDTNVKNKSIEDDFKPSLPNALDTAELRLAVQSVCHGSFMQVDHLCEMIKSLGEKSVLVDLKLSKTKTAMLVKNVLSPSMKHDLKQKLKNKLFTLMIDESTTDISSNKLLTFCVRYFDNDMAQVVDHYLDTKEVVSTTGEALFTATKSVLDHWDLDTKNIIGFASDGANIVSGESNSVWSRIREQNPNALQIKCICHSLALVMQHSFEFIPENIAYMIEKIPSLLSKSSLRRSEFNELYATMNSDELVNPTSFAEWSSTRWLARGKVLHNILSNWQELLAYFSLIKDTAPATQKFLIENIHAMLKDKTNYLYFTFLTPIVQEYEELNAAFQKSNTNIDDLFLTVEALYETMMVRVYDEQAKVKHGKQIDYGGKFIRELKKQNLASQEDDLLESCKMFLVEAISQTKQRIGSPTKILKEQRKLLPKSILGQECAYQELPFLGFAKDPYKIESEYRTLMVIDLLEELETSKEDIEAMSPVVFWSKIGNIRRLDENLFAELAAYALGVFSLPSSYANVERIFSTVNFVENKSRNGMSLELLNSIVFLKSALQVKGKCCHNFEVTPTMLEKFNENIYDHVSTTDDHNESETFAYIASLISD